MVSIFLFVQKVDGCLRLCNDPLIQKNITGPDRYHLALMKESLNNMMGMKFFMKSNTIAVLNNIPVHKGEDYQTAFQIRCALFNSLFMTSGLTGALETFQCFINNTLRCYLDVFCTAHLDDTRIYGLIRSEHGKHVCPILAALKKAHLYP